MAFQHSFYVIFQQLIPIELAKEYVAGAVILGAAPCTAMVLCGAT